MLNIKKDQDGNDKIDGVWLWTVGNGKPYTPLRTVLIRRDSNRGRNDIKITFNLQGKYILYIQEAVTLQKKNV